MVGQQNFEPNERKKPLKDKSEFKVKWASLRLLNALAREYPNIIQQVIQERPTGVSSLGFGSNQGLQLWHLIGQDKNPQGSPLTLI